MDIDNMDSNLSSSSASPAAGGYQHDRNNVMAMASCSSNSMDVLQQIMPQIDDTNTNVADSSIMKRFVTVLDQIDTRVEKLRRESRELQEKRDALLMSMDVIKNNEQFAGLDEYEREELNCYMTRIGSRLATIELSVKTIRDSAQEDSLHQINSFIDALIANTDRISARQKCQIYLNCCSPSTNEASVSFDRILDKKFELSLLGCTLDDQKNIKKRLQALMTYLNKQMVLDG